MMDLPPLKYNPGLRGDDELIESFVVRHEELDWILETLHENADASSIQHLLLVGPRGSGKTTLVRRVAAEIRRVAELDEIWFPLVFSEESYLISNAGEFWLEAIYHLADQSGDGSWSQVHQELQKERDDAILRDRALARLMDFADAQGKKILVVVENLNMLFNEQMQDGADWDLRHTLLNEPRVMLLGTATNRFDEIDHVDKAWFDLLGVRELETLSDRSCQALWESVTEEEISERKLRPIMILTGGNPRLLRILAEFAARRSFRELMDQLIQLVDQHTEYFKSHLDGLAPTERRVFVALLEAWDPVSAKEVGESSRMEPNKASVLLNRLVDRGVARVFDQEGRRKFYGVSERLYNIYYLMRRRGDSAQRVKLAVKFMTAFYDENFIEIIDRLTEEACQLPLEKRHEFFLAYSEMVQGTSSLFETWGIFSATRENFIPAPLFSPLVESLEASIARTATTVVSISETLGKGKTLDMLEEFEFNDFDEYSIECISTGVRIYFGEYPRKAPEIIYIGEDFAKLMKELKKSGKLELSGPSESFGA